MRNGPRTGGRLAVALAAALLSAGVMAGPWGRVVRADARALMASAPPGTTAHAPPPAPATKSGTAPSLTNATRSAQAAVDAAVPRLVAGRPARSVSVVGVDATSGVHVGWGTNTLMPAASVFKLTLLESFLLGNQDRGQADGHGESDALTAMMENSDNDAADQIYGSLGWHAGEAPLMRRLGLTGTVLGASDQWGLSTTSVTDQSTLLTNLISSNSPLSAASRAYALRLMTDVESDQRWGVGAAADPGTNFANKNGWLAVDDDAGRWVVSSVGLIQVRGHRILLAVLTQHNADLADGIDLVQSLSRTVAAALRGAA